MKHTLTRALLTLALGAAPGCKRDPARPAARCPCPEAGGTGAELPGSLRALATLAFRQSPREPRIVLMRAEPSCTYDGCTCPPDQVVLRRPPLVHSSTAPDLRLEFVLAHELGHLRLGAGRGSAPFEQESSADEFALALLSAAYPATSSTALMAAADAVLAQSCLEGQGAMMIGRRQVLAATADGLAWLGRVMAAADLLITAGYGGAAYTLLEAAQVLRHRLGPEISLRQGWAALGAAGADCPYLVPPGDPVGSAFLPARLKAHDPPAWRKVAASAFLQAELAGVAPSQAEAGRACLRGDTPPPPAGELPTLPPSCAEVGAEEAGPSAGTRWGALELRASATRFTAVEAGRRLELRRGERCVPRDVDRATCALSLAARTVDGRSHHRLHCGEWGAVLTPEGELVEVRVDE